MPARRDRLQLPRWISDPHVADFADPELLAWERAEDSIGPGGASYTACSRAHGRFMYALDRVFGTDQFPADLIRMPAASGVEPPPDGPPADLRAAVMAWQSEEDARMRAVIRKNSPYDYEGMLARCHVPPAVLPSLEDD